MSLASPSGVQFFQSLADKALAGERLTREDGLAVLESSDDDLLDLMAAAYRVRRHYFANRVQLYFLMNAKSGLCPEDCSYCSQSKISGAEIPKYNLLNEEKLMEGARVAAENHSVTYCIVISARGPSKREVQAVCDVVPKIKEKYPLKICACLGLLNDDQATQLKAAGVDRVNHNLNTSEQHYASICTTHTFADRIATLEAVRKAGMEICSGGILGMGEGPADVVDMALKLADLEAESIPVNFLNPIDGTPLSGRWDLNPRHCLRSLALFRLANPQQEIRIAGGREIHLRSLQPLGLYAANSLFIGDYLTTKGQAAKSDFDMLADMGFEVVQPDGTAFDPNSVPQADSAPAPGGSCGSGGCGCG